MIYFKIVLLLLLSPYLSFSQNENKMDSLGRKQGIWVKYFQPYTDFLGIERKRVKEKGHYLNDKRIGVWDFYVDGGDYYGIYRTITYFQDSGCLIQEQNSNIYVSNDSSFIKSFNTNNPTKYTICFLIDSGKYECRRVYPDKFNYKMIIVDSFDKAIKKVDTIWNNYEIVRQKKRHYNSRRKRTTP